MEGLIAQKGLWNLAKVKIMKERGKLPNEVGDAVREFRAMHEENFWSSWLRGDVRRRGERWRLAMRMKKKRAKRGLGASSNSDSPPEPKGTMGTVCTLNSPTGLAQSSDSNQRPVTRTSFATRRIALYRTSTSSVPWHNAKLHKIPWARRL